MPTKFQGCVLPFDHRLSGLLAATIHKDTVVWKRIRSGPKNTQDTVLKVSNRQDQTTKYIRIDKLRNKLQTTKKIRLTLIGEQHLLGSDL